MKRQRYQYRAKQANRHSTLTDDRQELLERLGFVWDSHALGWEERWNELREFKQKYGHCRVPKNYSANQQLAIWVKVSVLKQPAYVDCVVFYMVVIGPSLLLDGFILIMMTNIVVGCEWLLALLSPHHCHLVDNLAWSQFYCGCFFCLFLGCQYSASAVSSSYSAREGIQT